jgi:uncharacterized protein (TIRG00374 family)
MWSRIAKIFFAIVVPVFFLWLFFRKIDPAEFISAVEGVGLGWLLLILAALIQVVHVWLRSLRWRLMLGPLKQRIGLYNLFATVSIGYMVTMLLPGRVGEVLRPVILASREKISKSGALATVVLERLIDGFTVISLMAIYLVFFMDASGGEAQAAARGLREGWGAAFGVILILSFPVLWALVHFRGKVATLLEKIYPEQRRGGSVVHKIFHGVVDGFAVLKGGRALVGVWLYSFTIWLVIAFSIWFSLLAFRIHIPMAGSLMVLAALAFGIAIPTQGGVGTYEYFGQQSLTIFFGIEASKAAAAVLVMHIFAVAPTILMGLYFIWKDGLSFRGLRTQAQRGAGEERAGAPAEPATEAEA